MEPKPTEEKSLPIDSENEQLLEELLDEQLGHVSGGRHVRQNNCVSDCNAT